MMTTNDTSATTTPPPSPAAAYPLFQGIRVADFSWVIAAPLATSYLALLGAEVIRIESAGRLDVLRAAQPFRGERGPNGAAYWADWNIGKLGITLNFRDPRAVDLARRLIATCDVVAENFTAGTMDRLGLGYQELRRLRPDLIMLSMSLAGQTGPERGNKGFGTVIQGSAGITHFTGWPDRDPVGTGVAYTDFVAGHLAAVALMAALDHRRRSGEGQHIDLSQQEASLESLDAALIAASVQGVQQERAGNRHPAAAPHNAYPCRPDPEEPEDTDRWVTIAVMNDEHWRGLVAAMGAPAWAGDSRFATLLGRKRHEDELDTHVAAWTARHTAPEVEHLLAACGIPAAVVASGRDLHSDLQLAHRGQFAGTGHPLLADFPLSTPAYRLDGRRPLPPRPSPMLGQHNAQIVQDLLGVSADEFDQLAREGVLS